MFERTTRNATIILATVAGLTMLSACAHREPTNVAGLALGGTARLQSGGPEMTIEHFVAKGNREEAYCVWFVNGKRKHSRFPVEALVAVDSEFTPAYRQVQPAQGSANFPLSYSTSNCTADETKVTQLAARNGYQAGNCR